MKGKPLLSLWSGVSLADGIQVDPLSSSQWKLRSDVQTRTRNKEHTGLSSVTFHTSQLLSKKKWVNIYDEFSDSDVTMP